MKGIIAATALVLTALTLAPQAQARDQGHGQRGGQDHGRYDNRGRGWQGRNDWQARGDWRGHDGWHGRDDHRWGRPDYRPNYGYRYPRYYYDRPYYGYGPRYVYPPAYSSYYYDCDSYYGQDYRCDDDGVSLMFSLPLHF